MQTKRFFGIAALALLAFFAACRDAAPTAPSDLRTLTIEGANGTWYEGDEVALRAVVRDRSGAVIPGVPIEWLVSDPTRAELGPGGYVVFLAPGAVTITAKSGELSASTVVSVRRLTVLSVTVIPAPLRILRGEIATIGLRITGERGRRVIGRTVTIASDNPSVAFIDASGRLHGVSAGTTTVRATADGVSGTTVVEVLDQPARFRLVEVDAVGLPQLVATDSVWWNGVREYHEIWIESGLLLLTGTSTPRYDVDVRYVEYNVVRSGGTTTRTPRIQSREHDFGLVQYDSRGDLVMWSEYYSPLVHTAIPSGDSVRVSYRIPGDDIYLDLLFRRNQSSPNRALEART